MAGGWAGTLMLGFLAPLRDRGVPMQGMRVATSGRPAAGRGDRPRVGRSRDRVRTRPSARPKSR
jgi:hypothetical protein